MTDTCNILISSAGRRVALLQSFGEALAELGIDGRILAGDQSRLSSAFHRADLGIEVPPCSSDAFVPALVDACVAHEIRVVVPTIDPELGILAAHRDRFAAVGATVVVSGEATIAIAADKVSTHSWLERSGIPTVRLTTAEGAQDDPTSWPLPLAVKPRRGSGSQGFAIARDREEFDYRTRDPEVVVQTVAPGVEHSVDVLVDSQRRVVCAVPRRRLEVRDGEVQKAVTVRCEELEQLSSRVCDALPDPYGPITVQVFRDDASGEMRVIEVNPRFGGGFPLTLRAGANYSKWILEDVLGRPSTATVAGWHDGVVMLRYDEAVFIDTDAAGL